MSRYQVLSREHAIAVIHRVVADPPQSAVIVLLVRCDHSVEGVVEVSGIQRAEQVLDVLDCVLAAASTRVEGVIVASIRPDGGIVAADCDLWHDVEETVVDAGLRLIDWYVFGRLSIVNVGELIGGSRDAALR